MSNYTPDIELDLDAVRADIAELEARPFDGFPFCVEYLHQGIRHLQRNCDVECPVHDREFGSNPDEECHQPGRYGGTAMARLLNAVPALLARIDELEAAP